MPFYEYECASCKFYTEVMQKISDAPLRKCPSCGKNTMTKLVSAPVFRLKGAGWYETDFKGDKENKRNLAGADKEASSGDSKETKETKSEAPAESKPESKPAAKESDGPKASKPVHKAKPAARKPAAKTRVAAKAARKRR